MKETDINKWATLIVEKKDLPTPEVVNRMKEVLKK